MAAVQSSQPSDLKLSATSTVALCFTLARVATPPAAQLPHRTPATAVQSAARTRQRST